MAGPTQRKMAYGKCWVCPASRVTRATGFGNIQETGNIAEEKMREKMNRKMPEGAPKKQR